MRLMRDKPEWAADVIHNTIEVHFDIWDRLKILFGWRVSVRLNVDCEVSPGRTEGESDVSVWRPYKGPDRCYEAKGENPNVG